MGAFIPSQNLRTMERWRNMPEKQQRRAKVARWAHHVRSGLMRPEQVPSEYCDDVMVYWLTHPRREKRGA